MGKLGLLLRALRWVVGVTGNVVTLGFIFDFLYKKIFGVAPTKEIIDRFREAAKKIGLDPDKEITTMSDDELLKFVQAMPISEEQKELLLKTVTEQKFIDDAFGRHEKVGAVLERAQHITEVSDSLKAFDKLHDYFVDAVMSPQNPIKFSYFVDALNDYNLAHAAFTEIIKTGVFHKRSNQ